MRCFLFVTKVKCGASGNPVRITLRAISITRPSNGLPLSAPAKQT